MVILGNEAFLTKVKNLETKKARIFVEFECQTHHMHSVRIGSANGKFDITG